MKSEINLLDKKILKNDTKIWEKQKFPHPDNIMTKKT